MAKERLFNLPETKGLFQLKGLVTGVEKDIFYKESLTKTQKNRRSINFGVKFDDKKTQYVTIAGNTMDFAYFSKQVKNGEKKDTVPVAWPERFTYKREGYKLIGNNIGIEKIVDAQGNQVNNKKKLTDFDACKELHEKLKDNQSVFLKGKIDFSSFTTDKGEKKSSIKFVPNQVSLCGEVKFEDEKFEAVHDFTQTIVFIEISKEKIDNKETGRFIISAKIIGYAAIEDVEFIMIDTKLAQLFKKNLKPYTAIEVWGKLDAISQTEEIENDDEWGESNAMTKQNAPVKREMVITGANKASIDSETYSQSLVEAAMLKVKNASDATTDYADKNASWGKANDESSSSDEDADWD